jgi:hypothetical protein
MQQFAKHLTEPDAPLRDGELILQVGPYQCLACRQLLMLWPKPPRYARAMSVAPMLNQILFTVSSCGLS